MPKKIIMPLGIIVTGVLIISLLVVAQPKPVPHAMPEEPAQVQVKVTEGKQESLRLSVQAQGTVNPRRQIDLIAQVSGQVTTVDSAFVNGGFFRASQVLVGIDDREYQSARLNALSRVADAQQRLAEERGRSQQAEREWRDLGNETANNLFLRKPQLAAAEASLASAEGERVVADLNLERTQVSVPFHGRVRETHVDLGQYVTVGTRLATVYDSSVVEVRLPLTEAQAALIDLPLTPGTDDRVKEPIPVTLKGSVAGEFHQWQGLLVRTDAFVNADSRMYYAVVEVADPFTLRTADGQASAPLLPGLFVEAEIEGKRLDNVMQLPREALFGRDRLLTLDDDNVITEQTVRVLRRSDDQVWVQAALEDKVRITLEKQSLTPVGSEVDPVLHGAGVSDSVATTESPSTDVSLKD